MRATCVAGLRANNASSCSPAPTVCRLSSSAYAERVGVVASLGIGAAPQSWNRAAELSADRAAMLAVQKLEPYVGMMMKLAGGVRSSAHELDPAAFLEQARHLDDLALQSMLTRYHRFRLRTFNTHPLIVERARHFDEWIRRGDPARIIAGQRSAEAA